MNIPLDPSQGAAFLIAALLMPLIIAIVKQPGFPAWANSVIALLIYAVFGVLGAVFANIPITTENVVPLVVAAAVAGRLAYSMFWSLVGGDDVGNGSIDDRITRATAVVKEPTP